MRRVFMFLMLIAAVMVAGCGKSKQQEEAELNVNLKILGEKYVRVRLKDPDSADFQNQFIGRKGAPCGEVNSKNAFGGYTGFKRYISVGKDLTVIEGDMAPDEFDKSWSDICR